MKFIRIVATALVVLVLVSHSALAKPIVLVGACEFDEDYIYSRILRKFAEELNATYQGSVEFEFRYKNNSNVGREKDLAILIKREIIDFAILAPSHAQNLSKEVTFLDIPFLIDDHEHLEKVIRGNLFKPIEDILSNNQSGLMIIGYAGGGVRNIFSSKNKIFDYKNGGLSNLEIRVMDSDLQEDVFTALGMKPRPMPYIQLYDGIKAGFVDAAENESSSLKENKYYEVAPYLLKTRHLFTIRPIFFSRSKFDSLPDDLKKSILIAGKKSADWGRKLESKLDIENFNELARLKQITVKEFDLRSEFVQKSRKIAKTHAKEMKLDGVYEAIINLSKEH